MSLSVLLLQLQPQTALLAVLLIISLLAVFGKTRARVKAGKVTEKEIVRKEAADDEDSSDDEDKPALEDDLEHIPFDYAEIPEGEMITRSSHFYQTMNKRRTLRWDHLDLKWM